MKKSSLTKSGKIVLLLFLAALLAIVAGVCIYKYCNSQKEFLYVFNNNYSAGTRITQNMFTSVEVDKVITENGKAGLANDRYVTAENLNKLINSNSYLLYDVKVGQAFTYAMTTNLGKTSIEYALGEDMIAVTIPINSISGVTSELRAGNLVNIYSSSNGSTNLVLNKMKIIAVDKNEGELSSVTFECTDTQAQSLIYAQTYSTIYFGLVNESPVEE